MDTEEKKVAAGQLTKAKKRRQASGSPLPSRLATERAMREVHRVMQRAITPLERLQRQGDYVPPPVKVSLDRTQ